MSRRSFPRIDPDDLLDHADPARVERIWERIEHDLATHPERLGASGFEAARGRSTLVYLAIAAAFAAFGAGLWVGKVTWHSPGEAPAPVASAELPKSHVVVLAAGTQLTTHTLEDGTRLTLSPGSTVEVERAGATLTIALLQGEASIDTTGLGEHNGVALVAAEARVSTQAGSLFSARRDQDDIDVSVTDGTVRLTSPAGTQLLGKGDRVSAVPIHATASASASDSKPARRYPVMPLRRPSPQPADVQVPGQPAWVARYPSDEEGALRMLHKQGVDKAIDVAGSAAELQTIADLMRHKGRDEAAAVRASRQLVERFPGDQHAFHAANFLVDYYQRQGNADLAKQYRDQSRALAMMADALFCNLIVGEADKTKAKSMMLEYLSKYPNGQCHAQFKEATQRDDATPAASAPVLPSAAPIP